MITAPDFLKWLEVFAVPFGSGGGGEGAVLLNPTGAQTISTYGLTVPTLNTANLAFDVTSNVIASTNTNGSIGFIPNGTGQFLVGSSTAVLAPSSNELHEEFAKGSKRNVLALGSFINNNLATSIFCYKSRSTTIGSFVAVQTNDVLGDIQWYGDDGTQWQESASMKIQAVGAISSGIVPSQWTLSTTNTSGVLTTGMTLSDAQILTLANPLPAGSGGTGITSLGTGVATALGQNVTGSGGIVLATSPTLLTSATISGSGNTQTFNLVSTTASAFTTINGFTNTSTVAGSIYFGLNTAQNGPGPNVLITAQQAASSIVFNAGGNVLAATINPTTATFVGTIVAPNVPIYGTGVATALAVSTNSNGGFAVETDGTWTPTITFATAGDLSVSYANQNGYYSRVGNTVTANFTLVFTPTFTTASGLFEIASFPVASRSGTQNNAQGSLLTATMIFPTGTSSICLSMASASTVCSIYGSGSTVSGGFVSASSFVSGTQYVMQGTITYLV